MDKKDLKQMRTKAFRQEYFTFCALAPEKLIALSEQEVISFPDYFKLISLFTHFNFTELLRHYTKYPNHNLNEKDSYIFENGTDEEVEQLIAKHNWDFDDTEYISLFRENIKSEGLKRIFV